MLPILLFVVLKIIARSALKFDGILYHKECFVCKSCNTSLAGVKFVTKDDRPYCQECHVKKFSKKCELCVRPISGSVFAYCSL